MKFLRKLYDWVLHWAETPYGPLALFCLAFAESSFFPVPPDVLLIALCLGAIKKSWRFALITSIASILGGMMGYLIGFGLWETVDSFFFKYIPGFTPELFEKVMLNFNKYGFWYVFSAGFTPIPYKIFTIASGVFRMNFFLFVVASSISRSMRFFAVAALFRKFGPGVKIFIDKYFNLLAFAFLFLLIGGFLVIKYIF
ncbi:MAG: DedA family protein [Candidatus Aminicenantes bacterium]|nr:DedA family protein [Candidatus Aminicenantes bacterium]